MVLYYDGEHGMHSQKVLRNSWWQIKVILDLQAVRDWFWWM